MIPIDIYICSIAEKSKSWFSEELLNRKILIGGPLQNSVSVLHKRIPISKFHRNSFSWFEIMNIKHIVIQLSCVSDQTILVLLNNFYFSNIAAKFSLWETISSCIQREPICLQKWGFVLETSALNIIFYGGAIYSNKTNFELKRRNKRMWIRKVKANKELSKLMYIWKLETERYWFRR